MQLKKLFLASTALVIPCAGASLTLAADRIFDGGSFVVSAPDTADPGGNFRIGDTGTASLTVEDGGALSTNVDIILGNTASGDGTVTVEGGSLQANRYYIGLYGTGAMTLSDGATLTAAGPDRKVYLGYFGNAAGTLDLLGPGTGLSAYDLNIGWTGHGTMRLEDGATATLQQDVTLGKNSYTTGQLTLAGTGTTVTSDRLYIGEAGSGTLEILDGARYRVTGTSKAYLGWTAGSQGTMTIDGSGSSLTADLLVAGWNGTGSMTFSDGGTATIATDVILGQGGPGSGTATVTGAGSGFTADRLYVGIDGDGALFIRDGGRVSTRGTNKVYFGNNAPSTGQGEVSGAGSELVTGELNIGWNGTGSLLIDDSGFVSSTNAVSVGYANGSSGRLTLSDAGRLRIGGGAGTLQIGALAGATGTVSIGAEAGAAAAAAGTLEIGGIAFGAGTGTLVFNHTGSDYRFAAPVSGHGSIDHHAGTTRFTGASSGFTGSTDVLGGTLLVDGTLSGTLGVFDDGRLGGTGTIGTTTVTAGGILAPGDIEGSGTLAVNGNLSLAAGAIYSIDLGDGTADRVTVSGTATIGGAAYSIAALGSATSYRSGQTYTILSAAGGLTGSFSDTLSASLAHAASGSAFLDIASSADAHDATLTVAAKNGGVGLFAGVAETANQRAVAGALDTLAQSGSSLALYNELLLMGADEARAAFDTLSGEVLAGQQTALLPGLSALNSALGTRLRAAAGTSAPTGSAPLLAYAEEKPAAGAEAFATYATGKTGRAVDPERFAAWSSGFGSWGSVDGVSGGEDRDSALGGMLVGGDGMVNDAWRAGLFAGYSRTGTGMASSSGTSHGYHIGAYAGTQGSPLALRTGLGAAFYEIESSRQVLGTTLEGRHDAASVNGFGEIGYSFTLADTRVEPFAALSHTRIVSDSFTETGGAAALVVDKASFATTDTTLGLRAAHGFTLGSLPLEARGMLGWRHSFGDVDPAATARFATGDSFTLASTALDRNTALVEAGLDLSLAENATLALIYTGQFGETARENGFNTRFRLEF